ncbi:MAG: acyl-CoA synthetase [Qingshengfaniella sp.]
MTEYFKDWTAFHARMNPDATILREDETGRHFTYGTFVDRVGRLAAGLRACGVAPGDRVATLMLNSTDTFEIMFAAPRLHALFLPMNWRLAIPELTEIVGQAQPRILIYSTEFSAQAQALAAAFPGLRLIQADRGAPSEYETLATTGPMLPVPEDLDWNTTWTIIYTSGTTGKPKGALITYKMAFFNNTHASWMARLSAQSVCASFLPTFHIGGLNAFPNPVLYNGGSVIVMPRFDAARLLELMTNPALGGNRSWGVPTTFSFMAELPDFADARFNDDCVMGTGGAPMPVSLLETYQAKGVTLLQGWGMTETCSTGSILTEDRLVERIGSVGKPIISLQTRLVTKDGRDAEQGEVGEIWVKGPNVTPGYWNNPAADAANFEDGWFKTGDAMRQDEDGFLYMVDRWKDMYISGGENVYPAEVENVLCALPQVSQAAVIGIPDPRWGETGCAFLTLKAGAKIDEAEVIAYCNTRLARYKLPRRVVVIDEMPLNATGKMQKLVLAEMYQRDVATRSLE